MTDRLWRNFLLCQLALPPRIYSTAARSRSRWSLSRSRSFSLWLSLSLSTIAAVALWWEGCPVGSEKEKTQKQKGGYNQTALYICCTLTGPAALQLGIADRDMITLMCNYCTDIQMYMNNTGINPLTKTFNLIHTSVIHLFHWNGAGSHGWGGSAKLSKTNNDITKHITKKPAHKQTCCTSLFVYKNSSVYTGFYAICFCCNSQRLQQIQS